LADLEKISLSVGLCGGESENVLCTGAIGDSLKWIGGASAEFSEAYTSCTAGTAYGCREKLENGGDMIGKSVKAMVAAHKLCN